MRTTFTRALLLVAAACGTCIADPTIDFLVNTPTSGSISYAGGASPLVGNGIDVDGVVGIFGTPLNNNAMFKCLNCVLSFQTGGFLGGAPSQWTFGTGGSIQLIGSVDSNNNNIQDAGDIGGLTGTTLFSGYFGAANPTVTPFGPGFKIVGAAFNSFVDTSLAGLFGLQPQPRGFGGSMNISFFATGLPASAFTSKGMGSGNIFASTPEPGSALLMGTVLIGIGALMSRRQKRA